MKRSSKWLHSNRVILGGVNGAEVSPAYIRIQDGKIAEVLNTPPAEDFKDYGNTVIMPGVIDAHVHINEPGRTEWEGFETATRAAAAGGTTLLVDMPLNSSPVTTDKVTLEKKIAASERKLTVNVGCYGGLVPDQSPEDLASLIEGGVLGLKAFLVDSGIDEFPPMPISKLAAPMRQIAAAGLPLLVHCELSDAEAPHFNSSRSYQDYLATRPASWEVNAIKAMIELCRETSCRLHIVHLATATALPLIAQAKAEGLPITVETCPHYLCFNEAEIEDGDTRFKCAPPIRDRTNAVLLWEALQQGQIDFIATDHSPAPPDLKEMESGDFMKAWGGIASLQFLLPLVWTLCRRASTHGTEKDLVALSQWLCNRPAEFLGLENKGVIKPGADADLVIWDPEKSFRIKAEDIQFRHKVTPYENKVLYGKTIETLVGGETVYPANAKKGAIIRRSGA